jgi:predicted AAA+ superfamily ATPase
LSPSFFHFRSAGGAEVDLIAEINGMLYPMEIKAKSQPTARDANGFRSLRECFPAARIATGLVVCAVERPTRIGKDAVTVPWWMV